MRSLVTRNLSQFFRHIPEQRAVLGEIVAEALLHPLLQCRHHAKQLATTVAQTVLNIRPECLELLLEFAVYRLHALIPWRLTVETSLIDAGDQLRGELGQPVTREVFNAWWNDRDGRPGCAGD